MANVNVSSRSLKTTDWRRQKQNIPQYTVTHRHDSLWAPPPNHTATAQRVVSSAMYQQAITVHDRVSAIKKNSLTTASLRQSVISLRSLLLCDKKRLLNVH